MTNTSGVRLNKFLASGTDLSRRAADAAIEAGRVTINGGLVHQGQLVLPGDVVMLDGKKVTPAATTTTVMFHKPRGFVVSRDGQGSATIYEKLPAEYQHLNPVGRLDKYSSGLLLLTNDGQLAQQLTHPSYQKVKVYHVTLNKPLQPLHQQMITDYGVSLSDGVSKFNVSRLETGRSTLEHPVYETQLFEGRNRQIRRTFEALGYHVATLHRIQFGPYNLGDLPTGKTQEL